MTIGKVAAGKCGVVHDVKRCTKLCHSPRVKLHFVRMSASCFFGFDILDLDFWVKVDSVKQPVQSNSMGAGHVSHRRTSAFDDHLYHSFVVFENVQL